MDLKDQLNYYCTLPVALSATLALTHCFLVTGRLGRGSMKSSSSSHWGRSLALLDSARDRWTILAGGLQLILTTLALRASGGWGAADDGCVRASTPADGCAAAPVIVLTSKFHSPCVVWTENAFNLPWIFLIAYLKSSVLYFVLRTLVELKKMKPGGHECTT